MYRNAANNLTAANGVSVCAVLRAAEMSMPMPASVGYDAALGVFALR